MEGTIMILDTRKSILSQSTLVTASYLDIPLILNLSVSKSFEENCVNRISTQISKPFWSLHLGRGIALHFTFKYKKVIKEHWR